MKKTLLSTVLLVFSIISFNAQTIEFTVEAPAGIAGPYGFSSTNDVAVGEVQIYWIQLMLLWIR